MEKQEEQNEFIYPVPFEDFVGFRKKQNEALQSNFNIKQMSKLRKLKKLLEMTEQKICNRIKLFKKVSMDIQRKKQKQNLLHERFQSVKKNVVVQQSRKSQNCQGYMRSTKSSVGLLRQRQASELSKQQSAIKKSQLIFQEKHDHAKQIKMWKERNKVIVEQRKLKQMRDKVQSANIIRSNRHRAKQVKIQCEHERMEEARKMKEQRFKEEIEKYDELQSNLTRLQREEREALIMWKRAMESS